MQILKSIKSLYHNRIVFTLNFRDNFIKSQIEYKNVNTKDDSGKITNANTYIKIMFYLFIKSKDFLTKYKIPMTCIYMISIC